MSDLFSQVDPTLIAALWAPIVHYIARYTQDSHGKTRPFVAYLCVGMGFIVNSLFLYFGKETVMNFVWKFIEFSLGSFALATTIWVARHKPSELISKKKN